MNNPQNNNALQALEKLFNRHKDTPFPKSDTTQEALQDEIQNLRSDLIIFDAQVVSWVLGALQGNPVKAEDLYRFPQFDERISEILAGDPPESYSSLLYAYTDYKKHLDALLDALEKILSLSSEESSADSDEVG
jgi:hypothetical protein